MSSTTQYRGDDIDLHGEARDVNGEPVPLTGAQLFCTLRLRGGEASRAADSHTIVDPAAGTYRLRFTSASTAAMAAGWWVGDVRARLFGGELVTIGEVRPFELADAKTPTPA